MKNKKYEAALEALEHELVSMARWAKVNNERILVIFEGRDTAGKGGTIKAISDRINPRQCRLVALPKPTEIESTQWYFQRYVPHLPAAGEIVLFDRSWYNRAGVEKVMGFATHDQVQAFLKAVPTFEKLLVDDGIRVFKYWLSCDQEHQEERFGERLADPLKRWKLSPIDIKARTKFAEYSAAREAMFKATHSKHAPWTVVDYNDQKQGRLSLIRHLLDRLPDTHLPPEDIEWPELAHAPLDENFEQLLPIDGYRTDDE